MLLALDLFAHLSEGKAAQEIYLKNLLFLEFLRKSMVTKSPLTGITLLIFKNLICN